LIKALDIPTRSGKKKKHQMNNTDIGLRNSKTQCKPQVAAINKHTTSKHTHTTQACNIRISVHFETWGILNLRISGLENLLFRASGLKLRLFLLPSGRIFHVGICTDIFLSIIILCNAFSILGRRQGRNEIE
jgi:hypothetical protein